MSGLNVLGPRMTDPEVNQLGADLAQRLGAQFQSYVAGQGGTAKVNRVVQYDAAGTLVYTFTFMGVKEPVRGDATELAIGSAKPHHKTVVAITAPGAPVWALDAVPRLLRVVLHHLGAPPLGQTHIKTQAGVDPKAPTLHSATWPWVEST